MALRYSYVNCKGVLAWGALVEAQGSPSLKHFVTRLARTLAPLDIHSVYLLLLLNDGAHPAYQTPTAVSMPQRLSSDPRKAGYRCASKTHTLHNSRVLANSTVDVIVMDLTYDRGHSQANGFKRMPAMILGLESR